ncbi:hypothetical protein [Nocardioides convexus]|uniref:hypothetical protein n=1 Tax=Nocardioides convexus TaxID=2712224 RepID=UPI0031014ABA
MVRGWVRRTLWDVVPRDHRETDAALRRRQPGDRGRRPARGGPARGVPADRAGERLVLPGDLRVGGDLDGRRLRRRAVAPGPDPARGRAGATGAGTPAGGARAGGGVRRRRAGGARDRLAGPAGPLGRGLRRPGLGAAARRGDPGQRDRGGACSSGARPTPPCRGTR